MKVSVQVIAEDANTSQAQVRRYIRLTELIPELQEMVDNRSLAFTPAVELSHLKPQEQAQLLDAMEYSQNTPSLSQAQRIRKLSQMGTCSPKAMKEIMSEEKKDELDRITIRTEDLRKYFPKSYTPKKMLETILKLLEQWQQKRERQAER